MILNTDDLGSGDPDAAYDDAADATFCAENDAVYPKTIHLYLKNRNHKISPNTK